MIYKIFLFLAFLFVFHSVCVAQDSLNMETEAKKIPLNKYELHRRYKLILAEQLTKNDTIKIKESFLFLLQKAHQDTIRNFTIEEKIALIYVNKQFELINLKDLDSYGSSIYPDFYSCITEITILSTALEQYFNKNQSDLEKAIRQTSLNEEEKDFHLLHLKYITCHLNEQHRYYKYSDEVNIIANSFLQKYPTSIYANYVKTFVRRVYTPSNLGHYIGLGLGYNNLTKGLGDKFTNALDIRFGYELHFKKIYWGLDFHLQTWGSTKQEIIYGSGAIWKQDASAYLGKVVFGMGFWLLDTKKLRISPQVLFNYTRIAPKDKETNVSPSNDAVSLSSWNYGVGMNFDYKFETSANYDGLSNDNTPMGHSAIRLSISYFQPDFSNYSPNFNGQIYSIGLYYGAFIRNMKRKK